MRALVVGAFDDDEDRREVLVPYGMTLDEIFDELGLELELEGIRVIVDGVILCDDDFDDWAAIVPLDRGSVLVRRVPGFPGLGGIIAAVASQIAGGITVAAGWLGASVTTQLAVFEIASYVVQAAIYAGLAYAVLATTRSLAPPGPPTIGANSPSISGIRNRINPWGPFARLFGSRRIYPDTATQSFVEVRGLNLHFIVIYNCGMGPLRLTDMRIGDQPIENFPEVTVDISNGFPGETPLKLQGQSTNVENLNRVLVDKDSILGVSGGSIPSIPSNYFTVAGGAIASKLTISFPEGLRELNLEKKFFKHNPGEGEPGHTPGGPGGVGQYKNGIPLTMLIRIYWKSTNGTGGSFVRVPFDSFTATGKGTRKSANGAGNDLENVIYVFGADTPAADGFTPFDIVPFGSFFVDIKMDFPSEEPDWELEVSAFTTGPDELYGWGSPTLRLKAVVIQLVSFIPGEIITIPEVATISLDLQSTDALVGILDSFNVQAESLLRYYETGTGWIVPELADVDDSVFLAAGRTPAWQYAEILTGNASPDPQPDSQIDAERFEFWADFTNDPAGDDSSPKMQCDGYFDFFTSVIEALQRVAAMGQAVPTIRDGLFSVSIDYDKSSETPVDLITPRNTKQFSWHGTVSFPDHPHALRLGFKNKESDYLDDEILVYADGYNADGSGGKIAATLFADFDHAKWGITEADQVVQFGRRFLLEGIHRNETIIVRGDIEMLGIEKGDPIEIAIDIPLIGLVSSDIVSVQASGGNVDGVTFDEFVTFEFGKTYGLTWRTTKGNFRVSEELDNPSGGADVETSVLTFETPFPDTDLVAPTLGDRPFVFGELGLETQRWIVKAKRPMEDLTNELELVPLAPEIFAGLGQSIPSHTDPVQIPADWKPDPPTITSVETIGSAVVIFVRVAEYFGAPPAFVQVQVMKVGLGAGADPAGDIHDSEWVDLRQQSARGANEFHFGPVSPGENFRIRARTIAAGVEFDGTASDWALSPSVYVIPGSSRRLFPSDVTIVGLHVSGFAGRALEIEGETFPIAWDISVIDLYPDSLSDHSAEIALNDELSARLTGYRVRIVDPAAAGSAAIFEYDITGRHELNFEITAVINTTMNGGAPLREFLVGISALVEGISGAETVLLVRNPAGQPPVIDKISDDSSGMVTFSLGMTGQIDTDFAGVLIWVSKTQGFTPSSESLVHRGTATSRTDTIRVQLEPSTDYYIVLAQYDRFSSDPDDLILSAEIQHRTRGAHIAEIAIATFANLMPDPLAIIAYERGHRSGDRLDPGLLFEREVIPTLTYANSWAFAYADSLLPSPAKLVIRYGQLGQPYNVHPRVGGPPKPLFCSPGDEFISEIDYHMFNAPTSDIRFTFEWYDENGDFISRSNVPFFAPAAANVWYTHVHSGTAPAGCASFLALAQVRSTCPIFVSFSNFQLRRKIDGLVIGDAVITNAHIDNVAANKITTETLQVGSTISVDDEQTPTPQRRIDFGKLGTGPEDYGMEIRDSKGRVQFDADGHGVGSVTRAALVGQNNLLQNSSFEESDIDSFYTDVGGSVGAWTISTGSPHSGSKHLRFTAPDFDTGDDAYFAFNGAALDDPAGHVPCNQGDNFYFEGWGHRVVGIDNESVFNLGIRFYEIGGSQVGSDTEYSVGILGTFGAGVYEQIGVDLEGITQSTLSGIQAKAPANAHYVVFYLRIEKDAVVPSNEINVLMDDFYASRQANVRDLAPGAATQGIGVHEDDEPWEETYSFVSISSPQIITVAKLGYWYARPRPDMVPELPAGQTGVPSGVALVYYDFRKVTLINNFGSDVALVINSIKLKVDFEDFNYGPAYLESQPDFSDLLGTYAIGTSKNQQPVQGWSFVINPADFNDLGFGNRWETHIRFEIDFVPPGGGDSADFTFKFEGKWCVLYLGR